MDEKILKDIKDSLEMIVFILFLNVLATQCSGPSMSNVERSLEKIDAHIEQMIKKN